MNKAVTASILTAWHIVVALAAVAFSIGVLLEGGIGYLDFFFLSLLSVLAGALIGAWAVFYVNLLQELRR